jgi:hypothetical protein
MAERGFPQERNEAHGFRKGGASVSASEAIARLRELRAKATQTRWVVWGAKNTQKCPTIGVTCETGPTKHVCEMSWTAERGQTDDGPTGLDDAAAIVAAMNSLESLLACAEALEAFARNQFGGMQHQLAIEKARAALQALAEGGAP